MATFNDPNVNIMNALQICSGTPSAKVVNLSVSSVAGVGGLFAGSILEASTAITASTTHTLAGATAITTDMVSVTVSNASDAVALPAATVGRVIAISNTSATLAGTLFAPGGATINGTAGATGVALTAAVITLAYCFVAGAYVTK